MPKNLQNETAHSTLGERLLEGVLNLWQEIRALKEGQRKQGKVLDHHGLELEALKQKFVSLEKQVRGLKVSRGKALTAKRRAEEALEAARVDLGKLQ
jgi:hypothetical protein